MSAGPPSAKVSGLAVCLVAYLVAALAAAAVGYALPARSPILVAFAADLVATTVIFGFSLQFDNSSVYDPYWSVAPPLIAAYWLAQASGALPARQAMVLLLILVWAVRLTANWVRRWGGLSHEDWRYQDLRTQTGHGYWIVSFLGIHQFPTVLVFAGCLPVWPAVAAGAEPLGLLDLVATVVTAGGIALETVADQQLHRYLASPGRPTSAWLDTGLWAQARHPNYLGELMFWWGIWLFGLAADRSSWWTVIGPVSITALFIFVSVPMMDRRMLARRDGYDAWVREVPALVPGLRRGRARVRRSPEST